MDKKQTKQKGERINQISRSENEMRKKELHQIFERNNIKTERKKATTSASV